MSILKSLFSAIQRVFRSRTDLVLENAVLRQQVEVHQRQRPRPRFLRSERLFWIWLCRHWPKRRSALIIVKPETVLRWHREGYRRYWRHRSKGRVGRPRMTGRRDWFAWIGSQHRILADRPLCSTPIRFYPVVFSTPSAWIATFEIIADHGRLIEARNQRMLKAA